MTSARYHAGGAVVAAADAGAHRMLVAGGWDSHRQLLDSCELYDAAADRWSLQETRLPQPMCCRAAPIGGGGAVLTAQWNDKSNTRCALFDVRSSSPSWQRMASATSARRYHTVASVGDHSVVMLGGVDESNRTDTAQLYDARADRWSERPVWRLPVVSGWHRAVLVD